MMMNTFSYSLQSVTHTHLFNRDYNDYIFLFSKNSTNLSRRDSSFNWHKRVSSGRPPRKNSAELCRVKFIRWSVMRSWGKLYVRIFSDLALEPTCNFLLDLVDDICSSILIWYSRALRLAIATWRFWIWDRWVWHSTTIPAWMNDS